jgi:O-acetylserine/cysteine efflux transporter
LSKTFPSRAEAEFRGEVDVPLSGLAALGGAVLLFGTNWPLTKIALSDGAAPLWFAEGRMALSALFSIVLLAVLGRLKWPGKRDLPALLSVGFFQLAAFMALAHAGLAWVPAGRTSILSNATSLFVAPLAFFLLREPISTSQIVALGLGLGGVAVMLGPWAINWAAPGVLLGHVFLLAAAFCWAVAIVTVRRYPPRLSMLEILPWCFGLATLVLSPQVFLESPGHWGARGYAALLIVGLIGGPFGTWCVMQAAATLPAIVSSIGFLATPIVGLLLATFWLGEPLRADLVVGGLLILSGVGVVAWPKRRR